MINTSFINMFSFIDEGAIIIDIKGNIVFMNDSATKIDNVDKAASEGRHLLYVYPSLSHKNSILLKTLRTGEKYERIESSYRNYKGEEVNIISSIYPIFQDNKLVGAIEIFKPIGDILPLENNMKEVKKVGKIEWDFIDIIGKNKELLDAKEKAYKASKTDSYVLIYGETGTGKELFVEAIHNNSKRKNAPFIAENLSSIPENLIESVLFGTTKGSFTGAIDKNGLFSMAEGGTLYLDELNSLPENIQSKLLRVIQEKKILKIGDDIYKDIDVRIIASFNEDPEKLVAEGKLRRDLYYRINIVRINIPPIRKRKEDIGTLVDYFINIYKEKFNKKITGISKEALELIVEQDFNGNVREIKYLIEGIFNFKKEGIIEKEDIINLRSDISSSLCHSLKGKMENYEKKIIQDSLTKCGNNVSRVAKDLLIPRQTIQNKIKKYSIKIT